MFFKHSLRRERVENQFLQSHCPSRCGAASRSGRDDEHVLLPRASFYWLPRQTEEICRPHCRPKGPTFLTGAISSRAESVRAGILLKEDGVCVSPEIILHVFTPHSPLFLLYIYLYANKQRCHLETTSSALVKTAAQGGCLKTMATGACTSWICSSDIWNSSAHFTAPFCIDTDSLPITRVFK